MESWSVVHELFEITFWRFYHTVPWWRKWASEQKKLYYLHDSANEFAFLGVLNPLRFRSKAEKWNYDLWALEKCCQTSASCCFHALTRFVSLPFPCFHALLNFSAKPQPQKPQSLTQFGLDDGSEDTPGVTVTVLQKDCKKAKRCSEVVTPEMLEDEADRRNWEAVMRFQRFPAKKAAVSMPPDDVVLRARDTGVFHTTARCVAGFHATSEVRVILRPSDTGS